MSAIGPVLSLSTLTDLEQSTSATNTDKTFSPEGFRQPGIARWVDRATGVAIGFPWMTLQVRPPTQASRIYKVSLKIGVPTLEVTSPSTATGIQPQPTLAYSCQGSAEFFLPERSTLAERTAFLSVFRAAFADRLCNNVGGGIVNTNSPVSVAVKNFETPY